MNITKGDDGVDKNFGMYLVDLKMIFTVRRVYLFGRVGESKKCTFIQLSRFKAHSKEDALEQASGVLSYYAERNEKIISAGKKAMLFTISPFGFDFKESHKKISSSSYVLLDSVAYHSEVRRFDPFCNMAMADICKNMTGEEFYNEFGVAK